MAQTPKEIRDVTLAWIAPHATVVFGDRTDREIYGDRADEEFDGLFVKHKEVLAKLQFLQRFGSLREFVKLAQEHRKLLRKTLLIIPQLRDRKSISQSTRSLVQFICKLGKNAKICEEALLTLGVRYDSVTKKALVEPQVGFHRPKELFTVLVEEAFEQYRNEHGTQNNSGMRKAIVERLRPIFSGEALSIAYESPVSRAIENYIRKFSPHSDVNQGQISKPVKG
jgi:hypothetical protein